MLYILMSCEYCEDYTIDTKEHQMSLTHQTNEYNHFNSLRGTQVDKEMWEEREQVIDNYKDILENDSFSCPMSTCEFITLNKDAIFEHESSCFGARLNKVEAQDNAFPLTSLECKDCGKIFVDKGQKLKPKYALTQHKLTCKTLMPKKLRASIKKGLASVNDLEILKKIQELIKN